MSEFSLLVYQQNTKKMQFLASFAPYLLFISCLVQIHNPTKAQDYRSVCTPSVNYTSGSVYERNLNLTLNSLAANASLSGFYITSTGQDGDVVYGLVQCLGDLPKTDCHTCASKAASDIRQLCPGQKEASISYVNCSLQYSDWRFFSNNVDSSPRFAWTYNQRATDPVVFRRQLGNLVSSLSSKAASDPSKFAIGTSFNDSNNIYGMVQCTQDLTETGCLKCLQEVATFLSGCCDGNVGGYVISKSCTLRYENYFFFLSPIPNPPPPPPPAASSPPPPLLEPNSTSTNKTAGPPPGPGKKSVSRTVVIIVIPVVAALALIATICACWLVWKKTQRNGTDDVSDASEDRQAGMDAFVIELSTLKVATGNFSTAYKLGEGGFGPVYKGKLLDGREIAVKRLSRTSAQGLAELKTEVMLVAKLQHRNLVRLLGFCLEDQEKLLVYEYLPNSSLDRILFDLDQGRPFSLDWERRFKIIIGIARGLLYLHEDSQLRIIHRDLKASNILLDEDMNPKISDFGLAKLFCGSQTHGNTNRIAGTFGYMAPEYVNKGNFSTKSDTYSFGILVLEIITGRKNSSFRHCASNIQSHAWRHWANGTALELLDPSLGDQWPRYEVLKCIRIGLLCAQEAPAQRPTMSGVVMMLNSYTITSAEPSPPAFFIGNRRSGDSQQLVTSTESTQSINDLTVTELDPR